MTRTTCEAQHRRRWGPHTKSSPLAGVAWFVAVMVRAGEVAFALGAVGVIAAVSAIPLLGSLAVRRLRRAQK